MEARLVVFVWPIDAREFATLAEADTTGSEYPKG